MMGEKKFNLIFCEKIESTELEQTRKFYINYVNGQISKHLPEAKSGVGILYTKK